jgi:Na+-transporting NADH:ubiquinone oxidoreductase subunit F
MNIRFNFWSCFFSGNDLDLLVVIIGARSQLVSTGDVSIEINGDSDKSYSVPAGSKLLTNS